MASKSAAELWELLGDHEAKIADRIEALRDLELSTGHFASPEDRARLEALADAKTTRTSVRVPLSWARLRARRADAARAHPPGDPSQAAKLELAQQMLREGDAGARRKFVEGALSNEAFETAPLLAQHLENETDPAVRESLARAVGMLGDKDCLEVLKRSTRADQPTERLAAVEGLAFQQGKTRARLLLERLTDRDQGVRRRAREVLHGAPVDEVLAILSALPADKGSKLKRAAVALLHRYPEREPVRELLREYMVSDVTLVAAEALLALAKIGDDAALGRIMDLDGRCDARMQKVLELAKQAYGEAVDGDSGILSRAASDPGTEGPPSLPPDGPRETLEREDLSASADPAPAELAQARTSPGGAAAPAAEAAPPAPAPAPADDPGLAYNDTLVAPAPAPEPEPEASPPEAPTDDSPGPSTSAETAPEAPGVPLPAGIDGPTPLPEMVSTGDNPWDSIAQASDVPAPEAMLLSDPPAAPTGDPAAPPPPLSTYPANEVGDPKAEATAAGEPKIYTLQGSPPAPAPSLLRRLVWRLFLLLLLLGGLGVTGWWAYQAGRAANRVDKSREQLQAQFNRVARAVLNRKNSRDGRLTSLRLDGLVPEYLPEPPKDPWGHDLRYDPVLRRLISPGPDGFLDGSARYHGAGIIPDDPMRFLEGVPPPMAVCYQERVDFRLAALVPGTLKVARVSVGPGAPAPIRPSVTRTGGSIAYLVQDPDTGAFQAEWRRRRPGAGNAWEEARPVLPEGWSCSELAWVPGHNELVVIAAPGFGDESLYSVVPGESPRRLLRFVRDPAHLAVRADGRRLALSAQDRRGRRRIFLADYPEEQPAEDGLTLKPGPPGEQPAFAEGQQLVLVGKDPRGGGRQALFTWQDLSGESDYEPGGARLLYSSDEPLGSPSPLAGTDWIAFFHGNRVTVFDSSLEQATDVFEGPGPVVSVLWPYPSSLGEGP